jgi:hypothetical protein
MTVRLAQTNLVKVSQEDLRSSAEKRSVGATAFHGPDRAHANHCRVPRSACVTSLRSKIQNRVDARSCTGQANSALQLTSALKAYLRFEHFS